MTDQPSTEDTEQEGDFALALYQLNKGATHQELSDILRELTTAVTTVKKKGKIQLTLEMSPHKGVDGAVFVAVDIKKQIPRFDRPTTIFYSNDAGELLRQDPDQPSLFAQITAGGKEQTK